MVHKTIGVCVIGLAHVSEDGGGRRKQDKEFQWFVLRRLIQKDGSEYLRCDDRLGVIFGLFQQKGIPDDSGAMYDSVCLPVLTPDPAKEPSGVVQLRNIGSEEHHLGTAGSIVHCGYSRFLFLAQPGSSGENHCGPDLLYDML